MATSPASSNRPSLARQDCPASHPQIVEFLDEVLKFSARAREIVSRIQLFRRSERAERAERAPLRLTILLGEATSLLRSTLPAEVTLQTAIDPETPQVLVIFINPEEALAHFSEMPLHYDAMISDFQMPDMTGLDLAKKIMEIRPDLPVLIASGFTGNHTEASIRATGVRGLINKPTELAGILASTFQGSQP